MLNDAAVDVVISDEQQEVDGMKRISLLLAALTTALAGAQGSRRRATRTPLPNVTDGSSGRAPDLGALELGAIPPDYGPRP